MTKDKICVRVASDDGPMRVCVDQNYDLIDTRGLNIEKLTKKKKKADKGTYLNYYIKQGGLKRTLHWISFYKRNNGYFLDHLESPKEKSGFGKLGLAVFWAVLVQSGAKGFGLRFGGGENSEEFLNYLGFNQVPENYCHRIRDEWALNDFSVAIGDIGELSDGHTSAINLISIKYFPVGFFETNIDSSKYCAYN